MNRQKVSRNIKPAALWAQRQSGSKNFKVVAPLLQNDVDVDILFKGRRTITDCQKGAPDYNRIVKKVPIGVF